MKNQRARYRGAEARGYYHTNYITLGPVPSVGVAAAVAAVSVSGRLLKNLVLSVCCQCIVSVLSVCCHCVVSVLPVCCLCIVRC